MQRQAESRRPGSISEAGRRKLYLVGAHVAWWGAFLWTGAITWMRLERDPLTPPSKFESSSGIFIVLLIGIAIALGSALSRARMTRAFTQVFQAGADVGSLGAQERQKQIIDLLKQELDSRRQRQAEESPYEEFKER